MSNGISIVEGGGVYKTGPIREIYVKEALDIISSDKYKEQVEHIRTLETKEERDPFKEKLDYFIFAGTFLKRSNKNLIKASGIMLLDIDHVDDDFKKKLMEDEYVHFIFRSPSGDGFKAGVKIPVVQDDAEYKEYWYALAEHIGVDIVDEACKDISRACYASWDKDIYYNEDSVEFTEKAQRPKPASIYPQITPESLSDSTFATAVRNAWANGERQSLAMSVSGYLRKDNRMRWGLTRTLEFVKGICLETEDEEIEKRLKVVRQTYDKDEAELVGYRGLPDSIKMVIAKDEFVESQEEVDGYKPDEVNWTEDPYFSNSWKRLKIKTLSQLKKSDFLFQLFSSTGEITGKPQIRNNDVKTSIKMVIKAVRPGRKDQKTGEFEEDTVSYKLIDDDYNANFHGYEDDVMIKSYWVYDVIENGISYIVFCEDKLVNHEVHSFFGTAIKISHAKELQKHLSVKGVSNVFFCNKAESTIKPRPQEELIPYVREFIEKNGLSDDEYRTAMKDYIFTHPDGYVYGQPENYGLLKNAVLLSSRRPSRGLGEYPLHLWVWGGVGLGKTQELECLERIFQEIILEAANSTPKSLVPSYKEAIPDPGHLLKAHRVGLVDEFMKMVDKQRGHLTTSELEGQFGDLNFILTHKTRTVGSGNGSLWCIPTCQTIFAMNPSQKSKYLWQELKVIDDTTLSRTIPYVKGAEYVKFFLNNEPRKFPPTERGGSKKTNTNPNIPIPPCLSHGEVFRPFYVTIYDSCKVFVSKVSKDTAKTLFQSWLNLAGSGMKQAFKTRGLHHTFLLIDGLVKYRCLFEDFDPSFEAKQQDYDRAEAILTEMVKNWDYDMSGSEI